MHDLLIRHGRVIDPETGHDAVADVAVSGGRIAAVGQDLGDAKRVVDAAGLVVAPGFTDQSIYKVGGNPYGYSHTQGAEFSDDVKAAIGHQAKRLVDFAARIA